MLDEKDKKSASDDKKKGEFGHDLEDQAKNLLKTAN